MRFQIILRVIFLCISINTVAQAQNNAKLIPFYDKLPMMQDRQGYIWYAENSGRIGKYLDGDRLSDSDLFDEFAGCDYTNIIKEDIEGHIWIATGCRFYRFDPVKKKFEDIQQQILNQTKYNQAHTESWYEDTSGTVWFGGSALISYSLKTKNIRAVDKDAPSGTRPNMRFNLFGGESHTVWFSTFGIGGFIFQQYDPAKQQIIRTLNFDFKKMDLEGFMSVSVKTEKIIHGRPETYLVYIGARLFEFDAKAGTLNPIPVPETFGKATEIGNNGLYNFIGTNNGAILRYLPDSKNFELIWQHATKKPIEIIFPSSKGKEAFAYAENNLIPISTSPPIFKRVLDLTDSTLPKAFGFGLDNIRGKIYLNYQDSLVPVINNTREESIIFQPKFQTTERKHYRICGIPGSNQFWQLIKYFGFPNPDKNATLLLRDSSGNLIQTIQSPVLDSVLNKSSIQSIVTDYKKNVWILAYNGKICHFNRLKNEFKLIKTDLNFMMSSPKIMVDSKCNVWISNATRGLVRYDSEKENFRQFNFDPADSTSIASNHVTTTYEAADGHIWMGTKNSGISVMDPETGKFRQLNKLNGLPELTITDISESNNGVIWVATRQYICRWLPIQNRFIVYRNEDGLAFDASHGSNVFFKQKDGQMLVRTSTEILAFDPDSSLSYRYTIPSLLLTGFSIENKPVVIGSADSILPRAVNFMEKINLDYSQNKFTIQYAAVDFYGNVQYAYRLSGFDDDWQYVKNKTEAIYTNVSPGNYVFEVKVANHQGYWSEARRLPIYVGAPWYRTWLAYILYTILAVSAVFWFIQYRSRHLKKENIRLEEKVNKRTNELSVSLKELKETQQQLIQSEKMASLGELTAGIAHEIQNPLNFVNNFSEVSTELVDEMNEEIDKGNLIDAKEIANDLKQNLEKINHHGKRAGDIVKGMLQHSRTSSGQKEPTDINALADEYLRLAYHGLRAKDKSFNADFKTDFDPNLPKINVIPQDIGRVLLNLINNAFYAVSIGKTASDEKTNTLETRHTLSLQQTPQNQPDYNPTVIVSTKNMANHVEIRVKDNGPGIPPQIIDKIFQPFFTTKPTGQGTGLGLSLSYDILKAHGGELRVETKEGDGTEFIINLPAQK